MTAKVPWERVLDPSTVWVSKPMQALEFSSQVMETLVKTGKVKRVLPAWKSALAQKAADQTMRDADAFGDFLNREVAGGGGGALGMGAPTPATKGEDGKVVAAASAQTADAKQGPSVVEKKLELLGSKLMPEVESYEAVFSWPKDKKQGARPPPGTADVAVPLSPKSLKKFDAAFPVATEKGVAAIEIDAQAIEALKQLLNDPKRNPFLSSEPPKFVANKTEAARALIGAKQSIVADVKKSLAAAQQAAMGLKAQSTGKLFSALEAASKEATEVKAAKAKAMMA